MLAGLMEKFISMVMAIEHSGIQIKTNAIRTNQDMKVQVGGNDQPNETFARGQQTWQHEKNNNVSTVRVQSEKQNDNTSANSANTKELSRKHTIGFSGLFLSQKFNKFDREC